MDKKYHKINFPFYKMSFVLKTYISTCWDTINGTSLTLFASKIVFKLKERVVLGKVVNIQWTVRNHGFGETAKSIWNDYIYWTRNFTTDRAPQFLSKFRHSGKLLPLGKYDVLHDVTLPKYIFGTYFIFIHTDGEDNVYKHFKNDNNVRLSVSLMI